MARYDEGFSSGALAFAFLSGALLGAGMAFLLAPQPGDETRKMIRNYARRAEEDFLGLAREARQNVESAVEQGKDMYEEGKKVLGSAYQSGVEAVKRTKEQLVTGEKGEKNDA